MASKNTKVETTEETTKQLQDEGIKVETKDVLPDSLSTEIKGESNGPEFKAGNVKAGVIEKDNSLKVIRN